MRSNGMSCTARNYGQRTPGQELIASIIVCARNGGAAMCGAAPVNPRGHAAHRHSLSDVPHGRGAPHTGLWSGANMPTAVASAICCVVCDHAAGTGPRPGSLRRLQALRVAIVRWAVPTIAMRQASAALASFRGCLRLSANSAR